MLLPNRVEIKIISHSLQSKNPAFGVALLNEYTIPAVLRKALLSKLSSSELIPTELLNGTTMAEATIESQRVVRELPAITIKRSRSIPTRFSNLKSARERLENRRKIANVN